MAELYPVAFAASGGLITEASNPYRLERYNIDKNTTEEIKNIIDIAARNGSGLILYGHHIVGEEKVKEGPFSVSKEKMNEIIEYIQGHSRNIEIGLPSEVVQNSPVNRSKPVSNSTKKLSNTRTTNTHLG